MSDEAFQRALRFTMKWEGGYVNHGADPGGRTDHGIAEAFHPEAWADGKVTPEEAHAIYRADYWDTARCGDLPELVAVAVFDCAVNPGVTRAIQFLQAALEVDADGRFGVLTHTRALAADPLALALRISDLRAGYWLARARGEQAVFRRGWMNRAAALRAELQKG